MISVGNKLVVIDTHTTPEAELKAQAVAAALFPNRSSTIVNTHFHLDHRGGNSTYPADSSIWAADSSVEEMKKEEVNRDYRPLKVDELNFLGESIDLYVIGAAHSSGDVIVYDRQDKVLFMGDLFVNTYIGYLGEAHFREWIRSLKNLETLEVTTIVPGHGPLATMPDLQRFRIYLEDFVASAKAHFDKGGLPASYELPEQYRKWGGQFFLSDNADRAYELWQKGLL